MAGGAVVGAAPVQQNPRRIPSKLFSTTVIPAQTAVSTGSTAPSSISNPQVHPLRHTYVRSHFVLRIVSLLTCFCQLDILV